MDILESILVNDAYIKRNDTYNLQTGGYRMKGIIKSEESRIKQSKSISGAKHPLYGKHHSAETKAKIGNRDYSINSDKEVRAKQSKSMKETIKNRGGHWAYGTISHRKNKSMEDEYGIDKATSIKERQSKKASNRNKEKCIYCDVVMDVSNLYKYHNENCIKHTDKEKASINKSKQFATCPHCGITGRISGIKQWHFDNCKLKEKDESNITK